tara:strand:- start:5223 stop:5573 length:351 start_codon:yes stop_codon:yes gene_type:complete
LEVQESNLNISRGLEKIAKLLIENKNASIVGVLESIILDVLVDSTSYEATRNELVGGEVEEIAELVGNLLLTVKSVVLGAVCRLLTSGIVKLSLNLTNNLSERLNFGAESGNLNKA